MTAHCDMHGEYSGRLRNVEAELSTLKAETSHMKEDLNEIKGTVRETRDFLLTTKGAAQGGFWTAGKITGLLLGVVPFAIGCFKLVEMIGGAK